RAAHDHSIACYAQRDPMDERPHVLHRGVLHRRPPIGVLLFLWVCHAYAFSSHGTKLFELSSLQIPSHDISTRKQLVPAKNKTALHRFQGPADTAGSPMTTHNHPLYNISEVRV